MTFTLAVPFAATKRGMAELDYAASLARQLGHDPKVAVQLRVLASGEPISPAMVQHLGAGARFEAYKRTVASVRGRFGEADDLLIKIDGPDDAPLASHPEPGMFLVNGSNRVAVPETQPLILTKGESAFEARGPSKVLVPLGASDSGLRALRQTLPLIAALGCPIVLYHTTWKNPDIISSDPFDHVCVAAAETILQAQQLIQETIARAQIETVIECADGVVEGIRRAAIRMGCNLIVVARGSRAGFGSYAEMLARESPVPVLCYGRAEVMP